MARRDRKAWGVCISRLLPGDHIHHVAPTSSAAQSPRERIDSIDAARLKRMRKQQQRAAQCRAEREAKGGR